MNYPTDRTRNKQLKRVLKLLALICARRRSLADLSEALGVSTRTIRRDLAAIENADLPLYDVLGDDGTRRWKMDLLGGSHVTTLLSQRMTPVGAVR